MFNKVLGIDPGLDGGLGFLSRDGTVKLYKMPTRAKLMKSGKKRREIDEDALATIIRRESPDVAWVEDVHAIGGKGIQGRKDGVVGAFTFGEGKGILKGVLGALGVPRRYVTPQVWKGALRLSAAQDEVARARALFPAYAEVIKGSGPSEGLLIAFYGLCHTPPSA